MFAYIVRCTFNDADVAERWLQWMADEHLADVCSAGALDAEAIRLESADKTICEVRYHFTDRAAFEEYERDHAPRLRAEGLKLFPPELGLRYERFTGEICCQFDRKAT